MEKKTIAVHAGHEVDAQTNSRCVPLYMTTAFTFNSPEHASALFQLQEAGNIYTRLSNPTTDILERRLAALDGAACGVATATGMSAILLAVLNITRCGENFISSPAVYGGTCTLFQHTLARFGIEVRWVNLDDPAAVENAIDDKTRFIYGETISNPENRVSDFARIAGIAHDHGIPVMMDNTCAAYGFSPMEHGVDLVVYSLTKYAGGHGAAMGGMVLDSGKFDWTGEKYGTPGKFPELTAPDPAYHGMVFRDQFGPEACYCARVRTCLMRDLGPTPSPFNSWLLIQGLETLPLRWKQICDTSLAVAQWLESDPRVSWVNYPGLPSSPSYQNAVKYLTRGFGGIIGFGIRGGRKAGETFLRNVRLLSHVTNIGDSHSLVAHPASTTHQQLSAEELAAAGVSEDFVRLAIGLEDVKDIIADLDQAL